VVVLKEDSLVDKVLYRIVKKHVSGTTMGSALAKAKELNQKNIHASITFLSNVPENKIKARYITSTYTELIRRIARLGLKASVQVQAGQIGYGIDESVFESNLKEILSTGNKYGVFIWMEVKEGDHKLPKGIEKSLGFGLAMNFDYVDKCAKKYRNLRTAKIMCDRNGNTKIEDLKRIAGMFDNTVIMSAPDFTVNKVLKNGVKNDLVLEFLLGYSKRKLSKALDKGAKVSVSVPFGKDWIAYATDMVSDKYMRIIVDNLLKERSIDGA
jgi:hypothetical protein